MTNYDTALEKAIEVLVTTEKAKDWLDHFSATLGAKPVDILEEEVGLYRVMVHLNGIARHSARDL